MEWNLKFVLNKDEEFEWRLNRGNPAGPWHWSRSSRELLIDKSLGELLCKIPGLAGWEEK